MRLNGNLTAQLKHIYTQKPTQLSGGSSYIREVPLYFKFHVMPSLNYEFLNEESSIINVFVS